MTANKIIVPDQEWERDPDFVNAEIAQKRAVQKARLRALQAGIGIIVVQDGLIIKERPEKANSAV